MRSKFFETLACVIVLSIAGSGCKSAPRERPILLSDVPSGTGSLVEARKYLEGRWSLQSFDVTPPGKPPVRVTGAGTLVYDQYGNLDMEVRPDKASIPLLSSAGIETENGVLSTKGRVAVDMQSKTMTYIREGQPALGAATSPVALNRPRHWQVDGNVLTLTTNGDDGKPVSVGKWVKTP